MKSIIDREAEDEEIEGRISKRLKWKSLRGILIRDREEESERRFSQRYSNRRGRD